MNSTDSGKAVTSPSIVVTGDLVRETHLYQGSRTSASNDATSGFLVETKLGGANLLHELLETVQPGISVLGLEIDTHVTWPSYLDAQAIYAPSLAGFKSDPPLPAGKKPEKVWRVKQPLGYGNTSDVPPIEPPVKRLDLVEVTPTVLLVDDGGAGFRTLRAKDRWPDGGDPTKSLPPWVVLKMSQPLCESHLWRHLIEKCDPKSKDSNSELVVIVSADELRRDGAAINRGLSWERTISDICQTLTHNPRFTALKRASHLVVVFRREGVLWLRKGDRAPSSTVESQHSATLVFDAGLAEGQWKNTLNEDDGDVFGHLSVFTAAIALELAQRATSASFDEEEFVAAIQRGLIATRQLRLLGHGPVKKHTKPQFPNKELAEIIRPKNSTPPTRDPHQPQDRFVAIAIPCGGGRGGLGSLSGSLPPDWTIASLNDGAGDPIPLYGHGFQTAIYGPSRLRDIPHARFGDLLSVDRDEIETLRSLRQMIQQYEKGVPQKQPLCIGAFGPPGAGKSFGIKQIAYEILGKDVPLLEFNLSQFSDPADLIGAFHQVRDKVLSGRTPVVFWDEFDSQSLKWLQYLLAPMQDGKFQSGQLTHTLGKCIFVFAGATSWDFEHLGPAPDPANETETAELKRLTEDNSAFVEARQKGQAEFRLKKGPDFVSRLSGHINVLGPNRRLKFNFSTGQWDQPDSTDITFPVRRALLLRSFLKAKDTDTLDIDRDLLNGLLRQPRYRHGARSMEKTVEPLRMKHAALRPAQLPPPQVLAQHLDPVTTFQSLLTENGELLTQENVRKLAAAIHEDYRRRVKKPVDAKFLESFETLDASEQATNLAPARGIPHVLAVAGLCVVSGTASEDETTFVKKRLGQFIDALRREEHARWMNYMTANGWLQAVEKDASGKPIRVKERLLHTCLIPFDELPADERDKDHEAILSLPNTVALVGFKIVLFPNVDV
ncbi:MAG: AAA family ATPase [Planctomycetota bacterium]